MMLALLACTPGDEALGPGPKISVSTDVVTVATSKWTDESGEYTRVEVADAEGAWLVTDWQEPGGLHEATILGLLPGTEYTATVATESGAATSGTEFTTGDLPNDFPQWTTSGEASWEGYVYVNTVGAVHYLLVLDEQARPVWYAPYDPEFNAVRARPRRDGSGVVWAITATGGRDPSPNIFATTWLGQQAMALGVRNYTHDFVELDDGTLGALVYDKRTIEGDGERHDVTGNALALVDGAGNATTLWSAWDDFEPTDETFDAATGYWTHANAIDLSADGSTFTVGLRGLNAIVDIDAATGAIGRQVGGPASDYRFASDDDAFFEEHQFELLDDGILVFDNQATTSDTGSRVLQLELDDSTGVATATRKIYHDPPLWVYVLGDVDLLPDDGVRVTWTSSGVMTDYDADGSVRWELTMELGQALSYSLRESALPGNTRVR
ncbi:MAG: aryl-sulfate sulfotransferase [Deltaproteobacteria bacterium]|nr:aryl-sulfate sulfotransferase [Deltaproteobacteria bacterium]